MEDCDLLVMISGECSEALDYFIEETDHEEYNWAMYDIPKSRTEGDWGHREVIDAMKKVHRRELGCLNSLVRRGIMPDVTHKHLEKALKQTI